MRQILLWLKPMDISEAVSAEEIAGSRSVVAHGWETLRFGSSSQRARKREFSTGPSETMDPAA